MQVEPLWDVRQVADFLGLSLPTIWRMRRDGRLPPPICLGKVRRWDPAVLREWVEQKKEIKR